MTSTRPLRFLHRERVFEIGRMSPMTTVLDWLRLDQRLTGTKEGCGEGDCGACTVAVGRLHDGVLRYEPANACILLLGQLDGAELVTVEDLSVGGVLHPVQKAMLDHHASQCGFCTPGFVMSLFTLYQDGAAVTGGREAVLSRLAGNLCRCTGYRPIVEAALEACSAAPDDAFMVRRQEMRPARWPHCPTGGMSWWATMPPSSRRRPLSMRCAPSSSAIPTRRWSVGRPMSACGSPSSCEPCRRSSTPAG